MKCSWCTFLSNDNYLLGAISLFYSLVNTKTQYDFFVACTNDVSEQALQLLEVCDIKTRHIQTEGGVPAFVTSANEIAGSKHWSKTLEKIKIFDFDEYDKIVFLDADMYVVKNIDELFLLPHMSACCAGKSFPGHEEWRGINSGCMVIEPAKGTSNQILQFLTIENMENRIQNRLGIGDQDLINRMYYDWPQKIELHLPETYNCFFEYADYYIRIGLFKRSEIKLLHVIGKKKPWMYTKKELLLKLRDLVIERKWFALKAMLQWQYTLRRINNRLKKHQK